MVQLSALGDKTLCLVTASQSHSFQQTRTSPQTFHTYQRQEASRHIVVAIRLIPAQFGFQALQCLGACWAFHKSMMAGDLMPFGVTSSRQTPAAAREVRPVPFRACYPNYCHLPLLSAHYTWVCRISNLLNTLLVVNTFVHKCR